MPKYSAHARQQASKPRPWRVHPIWRGIGCLLLVLIPVISYAGAVLLVEANILQGWVPMPRLLSQPVRIPVLGSIPHLYASLMASLVLMMVGFSLMVTIYALIYRLFGPPHLSPVDAPPERRRKR